MRIYIPFLPLVILVGLGCFFLYTGDYDKVEDIKSAILGCIMGLHGAMLFWYKKEDDT